MNAMKKTVQARMTRETFTKFEELYYRLEPENLTCDGEASRSEILYRERRIKAEWRELEKSLGRKVKWDEVNEIVCAGYYTCNELVFLK
jgi:hypothetical protein